MSKQFESFITNVLAMPHYSNNSAGSGVKHNSHEDALASELQKVGYTEVIQLGSRINRNNKKVKTLRFPLLRRDGLKAAINSTHRQAEIAKLVPGMKPGEFIRQPCGSQSFPDFLICDTTGAFILVEAKSGNGVVPAWNDSLVKKDAIYIFSSGRYNATTVFLGQDVLDAALEQYLITQYNQIRNIIAQTQTALQKMPDVYNRGFSLAYARPKFEQGGGGEKVDYFKHADRQKCEENVLAFALAQ